MKLHEWILLFHDHFQYLDNQFAASDVVPSAREIRIPGSEFKFFVSIFRKLEEIIIKNREQWQSLKIVRFFLSTISHTCGAIKPPSGAAIMLLRLFVQLPFSFPVLLCYSSVDMRTNLGAFFLILSYVSDRRELTLNEHKLENLFFFPCLIGFLK